MTGSPTRSRISLASGPVSPRRDRARFAHLLPCTQRNQFNIVHDDVAIQVRHQLLELIGRNLQLQPGLSGKRRSRQGVGLARDRTTGFLPQRRKLFAFPPHRQVALDASLRIQHQVPCPGIGKQVVH